MKIREMRKAFSMMTAIFVMMVMGAVSLLVMDLSGKIVKATTDQYMHEQASLYAKSYTEYAVLAVTGNDRSNNCLSTINGTIGSPSDGAGYIVTTHISYIGTSAEIGNCANTRRLSTNVTTASTPLSIIVDAYVDYKDPDNDSNVSVHRRTIQKI